MSHWPDEKEIQQTPIFFSVRQSWRCFGHRTDRCFYKPPPFCREPQKATAWAQELVFWWSLDEKERHNHESCSHHVRQERDSHKGKCPCQANCSKWIPKAGEHLLFKNHHCMGKLWGYWCLRFPQWRLGRGWICLCWMFSLLTAITR